MSAESRIIVKTCDTWDEFRESIRCDAKPLLKSHRLLYRGHREVTWRLQSLWERQLEHSKRRVAGVPPRRMVDYRDEYLRKFKVNARELPTIHTENMKDDDAWWALGRHHGLITPLLDWTLNPYVAAFFAITDLIESHQGFDLVKCGADFQVLKLETGSACIWRLAWEDRFRKDNEFALVDNGKPEFRRQQAQLGLFTHLNHDEHLDLESYLGAGGFLGNLARFELRVSKEAIRDALTDFRLMNISYASLYPGPTGAAKQTNFDAATILFENPNGRPGDVM